jgi:aryl-alcohol dehydrogenase-like predicted oxidoreductase
MRRRALGTEKQADLSVIGYGGWELGGRVDRPERPEGELVDAVLEALASGINWIDTAETYGAGRSERIVGRAVREWKQPVMIASKLAPIPSSSGSGFEPWQVRWGLQRALTRIGQDHVDIYMLHWPDPNVEVSQTWEAMAELVEGQMVKWIGLSNFPEKLVAECERIRHVDVVEVEFSLLRREAEKLIQWCATQGIGVFTYGSLAYGILTTSRHSAPNDDGGDWYKDLFAASQMAETRPKLAQLASIASEVGCTPGQLALAWTANQPGVTAALAGSKNPVHIRENAAAGDIVIDSSALVRVGAIFAAPAPA